VAPNKITEANQARPSIPHSSNSVPDEEIRAGIKGLVVRAGVGERELFVRVGVKGYSLSTSSSSVEVEGLVIRAGEEDYSSSSLSSSSSSSSSLSSLSSSLSSLSSSSSSSSSSAEAEGLVMRAGVGGARAGVKYCG